MIFTLSSHNVIQYLQKADLCSLEDGASAKNLPETNKKNANLLVTLKGDRTLLVKQEHQIDDHRIPQEFFKEWLFHQLLQQFPVLGNIAEIASLVVHFDEENFILIRNYLTEYLELGDFYQRIDIYPSEIATAIGSSLGVLHRATFNRREYRDFMATAPQGQFRYQFYNPAQGIESINLDIFGNAPTQALKFYALYQRYESIEAAIAELAALWEPCCLTHNDLKLENILVHSRWNQLDNCLVRLIDWEACAWGEPAFDLGTLVASYLRIWLESLVVDASLTLEESLQLAATPLEFLQPSILALIQAYLNAFPMILEYRHDLIQRVVQFAGLILIQNIQDSIQDDRHFDNMSVYILQVAKDLLTKPQESVMTVFGLSESEIVKPFTKLSKHPQANKEQNLVRVFYNKTRLRGC
ncbi:aminoglycoside phosphotransferase family protein [Chlorogloeopsis sp. ULAP02]|uniref:aminoglycoside phosphotransferase family protein n=1 Tax=Chlorogloeopsis sp. ULAP02 TaxID=3107926 RepID=UPI0031364F70